MTQSPALSFEFFPPRSDAQARRFWRTLGTLEVLKPEYVSVTFGALGTDCEASFSVLEPLGKDQRIPVAAHLTCIGQGERAVLATLDRLEAMGIDHIVALRGDARPGVSETFLAPGERVLQHASELVELIARRGGFDISVSAYPEVHPEARDADQDLHWLAHKWAMGARRAITQFFFDADVFLRFRDRAQAAGVGCPLVPGVLPIHDIDKVRKFAGKCGASVPEKLGRRFDSLAGDAAGRRVLAIDSCVQMCEHLKREGVGDFHLYTLNQSELSYDIGLQLGGHQCQVAA